MKVGLMGIGLKIILNLHMKKSIGFQLVLGGLSVLSAGEVSAISPHSGWGMWEKWGDQGDGTFINPVIPSDYSDLT